MATTIGSVLGYARTFASTDVNGINTTNGLNWANDGVLDIRTQFCVLGIDAGVVQETYANATANVGTYNYPTDFLALKAMEVNLISTNQQDYKLARKTSVANPPPLTSFDWQRVNQNTLFPLVNDHGSWFEIFPTPTSNMNLTNAIRMFYWQIPVALTATGNTLQWPENIDPYCLAHYIAGRYYQSVKKQDKADKEMMEFQRKLNQIIGFLQRGGETPTSPQPIQDPGWSY